MAYALLSTHPTEFAHIIMKLAVVVTTIVVAIAGVARSLLGPFPSSESLWLAVWGIALVALSVGARHERRFRGTTEQRVEGIRASSPVARPANRSLVRSS